MEYSNIHDCEIYSYEVSIERETVVLHTVYRGFTECKYIIISFSEVLTHCFEDILRQNVISDIYESEIKEFIEEYKGMFELKKSFCWPIDYKDEAELYEYLEKNSYGIYRIDSSIGLYGFVIAKCINIDEKSMDGRPVSDLDTEL